MDYKKFFETSIINHEEVFMVDSVFNDRSNLNDFLTLFKLTPEQELKANELISGQSSYQFIFNSDFELIYVLNPEFHSLISAYRDESQGQTLVVIEPQFYLDNLSIGSHLKPMVNLPIYDIMDFLSKGLLIKAEFNEYNLQSQFNFSGKSPVSYIKPPVRMTYNKRVKPLTLTELRQQREDIQDKISKLNKPVPDVGYKLGPSGMNYLKRD